jgi:hypothetical protein
MEQVLDLHYNLAGAGVLFREVSRHYIKIPQRLLTFSLFPPFLVSLVSACLKVLVESRFPEALSPLLAPFHERQNRKPKDQKKKTKGGPCPCKSNALNHGQPEEPDNE